MRGVSEPSGVPTTADLVERARALAPLFDAHGDSNEDQGVLSDEVVAALDDEGFFKMWVPLEMGGVELDTVRSLEVIEELSRAEASTGWVVMAVALATGTGAAYLDQEAVDELFADGRTPLIAGQGFPNGTAVPEGDGFRLSGHWSYGSGIKHTSLLHSAAVVRLNGSPRLLPGGSPEVRIFVTPREEAVYGDNWDVLGLRATASIDYSIDSVFVPAAYTHVATTETPRRGGNLYSLGIPGLATICHSGWALGVGRRMLDELVAYVRSNVPRAAALARSDSFLEDFARQEARYRAARAFVREIWEANQQTLDRNERLTTRQRTLAWVAVNHVTRTVSEVCMFAYTAAGGVALRRGVLQRLFRDMHAGAQHASSATSILREGGRELAGLAPGKVWVGLGTLVDPVA
jgi:alkylation response protein AidB-like acyl-CoA dehydrogenase